MRSMLPPEAAKDADAPRTDWWVLKILMPYLWHWPQRVIMAMALLVLAKVASVILPIVLKYIVDSFNNTDLTGGQIAAAAPIGLLLLYGALRLGSVLFGELRDLVFGRVTEQAMHSVALKVFTHLHKLDLSFHLERRTGGLSRDIERGLSGISFLLRFMLFNILPTLLEISLVAGILAWNFGWIYGAITFLAVVIYVAFSVMATEWRTQFVRETNKLDSKASTRAVDALLNYETVKYFTNEQYETHNYDQSLSAWEAALRKNRLSLTSLNSGQAVIISVALTLLLVMAGKDVASGAMTIGDLVMVNAYLLQLFMPLNFLGFVYREIKSSLANMARMFTLLDKVPTIEDAPHATQLTVTAGHIRFNNVEFAYHAERPILKGITFDIPAGHKVAVVGASGAGKSTLARLLFRFYDTNKGNISIDEQNIQHITQHSLRQAIGVVPQDTVLFNDSIEYNIRYGNPAASDAEVHEAAKLAHLAEFIETLPAGYQTMVGERGLKLSGGEKQRIAIARTILKKPAIMLFDEATSSLDSESEQAILQALKAVAKDRSTLVIAHRLSTIIDADKIVVLHAGQIVEQGTHSQLLQKAGRYAELWRLQQQDHSETT